MKDFCIRELHFYILFAYLPELSRFIRFSIIIYTWLFIKEGNVKGNVINRRDIFKLTNRF